MKLSGKLELNWVNKNKTLIVSDYEEIDKGIPSQNIFIAGFSQGGSVALAIAMASQYELGGVL